MDINSQELKTMVVRPALNALGENSLIAERYLIGLATKCAHCGEQPSEINTKKGLGIYKITPASHTALWDKYLAFDPELASKVRGLASQREFLRNPHAELATNLTYASAIAWLITQQALKEVKTA